MVAPGGTDAPGGIGRLVGSTVRYWRAAGMQPPLRVVDPYGSGSWLTMPLYFVRALVQILGNASRGNIAAVHIHMSARGSALRKGVIVWLASGLRLPILLHQHGSALNEFHAKLPRAAQRFLQRTLARADRIVVVGEYWREVLIETLGVEARKVRVVPNAVAAPPAVERCPHDPPVRLLFVGQLSPRKGLPELLSALASDKVFDLPWRLQVAGSGDSKQYARQAADLRIAARVELCGWVTEARVHELLAQADVFVLPSHNEGLSMAMLEAMAHGCAIIATPAGATLDAVRDGESALLVPAGDTQRLAAALYRVITDAPLRAALQSHARQRFQAGFDIATHCRQLAALYREVCPGLAHSS